MRSHEVIVRAAIYPGIGIARVGNSGDAYLIGPEVPDPEPLPAGSFKDAAGALKRQAARFRIYGYDASGRVVAELTADNAEICWTVHVANKKAAWYCFQGALDLPEATATPLRNAAFQGADRTQLVIDPGPCSIAGRNQSGPAYHLANGQFCGRAVALGELRTDEQGRLIFLGGHGHADTVYPQNPPSDFANNDGWYDDTSDGPVTAEVRIDGRLVPVDPAWVVTAPPNYAPAIVSVQTMYDVLVDTYQHNWLRAPARPSFSRHIYPLLRSFCAAQWVNFGFQVQHGWGSPHDFLRPEYLAQLADNAAVYAEVRRQVFNMFRDPHAAMVDVDGWPQMYGDSDDPTSPRQYFALTKTQYAQLRAWADGDFVADEGQHAPPRRLADVPLAEQPATLDRAALTFCLGGPFHPGCELTWPMRHISLYYAPFRIKPRAPNQPEPEYGPTFDPALLHGPRSPLTASGPGDLTRWMAVPWHTDTASCRAGYEPEYDPFLPTYWPARVPNHVLREQEYRRVIDPTLPLEERRQAFLTRAVWLRGLRGEYLDQIRAMVADFGLLGVIEPRPGAPDDAFPGTLYVESPPGFADTAHHHTNLTVGPVAKVARRLRRAPAERGVSARRRRQR